MGEVPLYNQPLRLHSAGEITILETGEIVHFWLLVVHADLGGFGEDVLDDVEDLIHSERLERVGGVEPRLLPRVAQRGDLYVL